LSNCGKGAPWLGNTLGKDYQAGIVPPPWTPVKIANGPVSKVSVWGRDYSFGGATALPVQIASQGATLLSAPVTLQVVTPGGATLTWKSSTKGVQPITGNAVAAHVQRNASAMYNGSVVTLTTSATIEYDGLVWISVSLEGLSGTPIDVNLEIPLRSSIARYTHRPLNAPTVIPSDDVWGGTRSVYSGEANWRSTPNGLSDWVGSFIPYWWLGNNEAGLTWVVEEARAWPNWHGADIVNNIYPIELQYTGNKAVQRLRLLRSHLVPQTGWKFEFGLQATPVKMPILNSQHQRWRARSTTSLPNNDPLPGAGTTRVVEVGDQNGPFGNELTWTVAFGDPELDPAHKADYTSLAKSVHALGGKLVQYTLLTDHSTGSPEWAACGADWQALPNNGGCYDGGLPGGVKLCHTDPESSFADFIVWKSNAFMTDPGIGGFYHDQTVLNYRLGWTDPVHGLQPTYPIRGYRELYRRVYTQAKKGESRFLFANVGGEVDIPVLAYEDGYLDGEQLVRRLPNATYIDRYVTAPNAALTLDEFRAEFMGRQWGLVPFFYPKSDPYGGGVAATDELLALLILHNVGLFGDYADDASVTNAYKILDAFPGFVDASFTPYFKSPAPVHVRAANVYGSVYKNAFGHGLVVLANFNDAGASVSVTFDPKYFPTISKVEALTPILAAVPKAFGKYTMMLPGYGSGPPGTYKLLHIYP
jgi:hypothetical protein